MVRKELEELFGAMPKIVKEKLQPVMDNLLERAGDLDEAGPDSADYDEEYDLIRKEVNKVKYLNDQWQILNAKKNN